MMIRVPTLLATALIVASMASFAAVASATPLANAAINNASSTGVQAAGWRGWGAPYPHYGYGYGAYYPYTSGYYAPPVVVIAPPAFYAPPPVVIARPPAYPTPYYSWGYSPY